MFETKQIIISSIDDDWNCEPLLEYIDSNTKKVLHKTFGNIKLLFTMKRIKR